MKTRKKIISIIATVALAMQGFMLPQVMADAELEPTKTVLMVMLW